MDDDNQSLSYHYHHKNISYLSPQYLYIQPKTMESFTVSTTLLIYTISEKCVAMGALQLCTICQHAHTKQI